ncbi:P-loop containing nucleoside triphosphate hydrolase protein [Colletotrichum eremochloae]|nr:P-loop containing nucleoside triphosphate hydrolase protein [Colletotrichum eremochloae]
MSDILRLTKASFLSGGGDSTSQGFHQFLDRTAPGFGTLSRFFSTWLRVDLATVVLLISFGGDIPRALTGLQNLGTQIYWWITRFFTASISIGPNDKLNREVLNWLGAHVLTRQGTRVLTARTEVIQNEAWYWRKPVERDDLHHEKRVPVQYLPTFGTTWFVYEKGFFMVRRVSTRTNRSVYTGIPDEYSAAPEGDEPLVVLRLGRSIQPVKDFLDNCRAFADKQREAFITVRATKNHYNQESWDTTILRPIRPLETVHFDEKTKQELVLDIEMYLNQKTRKFYTERGIPYRRGYLFYGPPGTGKTSLSLALASYFNLELYLLHIPSIRDDNDMENLFTALPPKCIVLLEDIDAVGIQHRKKFDADDSASDDNDSGSDKESTRSFSRCRCTLSGLLNVLDGVASQEGRIVLMTSNVAHKLDRALVRPGRIDRMIYLGRISPDSAKGMFERMYRPYVSIENTLMDKGAEHPEKHANEIDQLAERFRSQIPDDVFTPAQLQGYLLHHRNSPQTAADCISDWIVQEKAVMDEAEQRKKASAERKAKKKKALKRLKALKALASEAEKEGVKKEDEAEPKAAQVKEVPKKEAPDVSDNNQATLNGTKHAEDESDGETNQAKVQKTEEK